MRGQCGAEKEKFMASGTNHKYYNGKIAITFGVDLFGKVNEISEREGKSFASVVRAIIQKHFDDA